MQKSRRLVSKQEFIAVLTDKFGLYFAAGLALLTGMLLMFALLFFREAPTSYRVVYLVVSVAAFNQARDFFKQAKTVGQVEIVTEKNSHLLPQVDSLVRESCAPNAAQQQELLRASRENEQEHADTLLRPLSEDSHTSD